MELWGMQPPIEKMDATLSGLVNCERLSLSSNYIDKIVAIQSLKKLKILSLGRNNIRSLNGIEAVSETLEQLWISYNYIDKLRSLSALKKLKVLYISYNLVKEWQEVSKINDCPQLADVGFVGNPIWEKMTSDGEWVPTVSKKLPNVKRLDGYYIFRDED